MLVWVAHETLFQIRTHQFNAFAKRFISKNDVQLLLFGSGCSISVTCIQHSVFLFFYSFLCARRRRWRRGGWGGGSITSYISGSGSYNILLCQLANTRTHNVNMCNVRLNIWMYACVWVCSVHFCLPHSIYSYTAFWCFKSIQEKIAMATSTKAVNFVDIFV